MSYASISIRKPEGESELNEPLTHTLLFQRAIPLIRELLAAKKEIYGESDIEVCRYRGSYIALVPTGEFGHVIRSTNFY